MREMSRAARTPGEPVAMITYASFCSIYLFKQNLKQDLPLTGPRIETAPQARLYSDDSESHLVTNNVSHRLPKSGGMSLVLFSKATKQPKVTEALLAIRERRGRAGNI
jgi:hypothetical protein